MFFDDKFWQNPSRNESSTCVPNSSANNVLVVNIYVKILCFNHVLKKKKKVYWKTGNGKAFAGRKRYVWYFLSNMLNACSRQFNTTSCYPWTPDCKAWQLRTQYFFPVTNSAPWGKIAQNFRAPGAPSQLHLVFCDGVFTPWLTFIVLKNYVLKNNWHHRQSKEWSGNAG